MQQQPPPPPPHAGMPGSLPGNFPLASITTEQIQKYLDENKQLILAILDNQNLGKLAECAQYQAQLQKNLLYLAAIADAQPQIPAIRAPTLPHPAMQAAMAGPLPFMQQQLPVFAPRPPSAAVAFHQAQQMQMAQHQFHRPQQLAAAGIDNGDISAGSSDAFRRSSGEERGGAAGSRDTTTPAPAPSSSSLQKA